MPWINHIFGIGSVSPESYLCPWTLQFPQENHCMIIKIGTLSTGRLFRCIYQQVLLIQKIDTMQYWLLYFRHMKQMENTPPTSSRPINVRLFDAEVSPTKSFDAFIEETLKRWKVPGLGIAIVSGERTECKVQHKYSVCSTTLRTIFPFWLLIAKLRRATVSPNFPDRPVTSKNTFQRGQVPRKPFTAAALSLSVHDNDEYPKIQWTAPVSSILRDDFFRSTRCSYHTQRHDWKMCYLIKQV